MIICTAVTAVNVITQNTRQVKAPMIIEFMGGVFFKISHPNILPCVESLIIIPLKFKPDVVNTGF